MKRTEFANIIEGVGMRLTFWPATLNVDVKLEGGVEITCWLGPGRSHQVPLRIEKQFSQGGGRAYALALAAVGGDLVSAAVVASDLVDDWRSQVEDPCVSIESPRVLHDEESR